MACSLETTDSLQRFHCLSEVNDVLQSTSIPECQEELNLLPLSFLYPSISNDPLPITCPSKSEPELSFLPNSGLSNVQLETSSSPIAIGRTKEEEQDEPIQISEQLSVPALILPPPPNLKSPNHETKQPVSSSSSSSKSSPSSLSLSFSSSSPPPCLKYVFAFAQRPFVGSSKQDENQHSTNQNISSVVNRASTSLSLPHTPSPDSDDQGATTFGHELDTEFMTFSSILPKNNNSKKDDITLNEEKYAKEGTEKEGTGMSDMNMKSQIGSSTDEIFDSSLSPFSLNSPEQEQEEQATWNIPSSSQNTNNLFYSETLDIPLSMFPKSPPIEQTIQREDNTKAQEQKQVQVTEEKDDSQEQRQSQVRQCKRLRQSKVVIKRWWSYGSRTWGSRDDGGVYINGVLTDVKCTEEGDRKKPSRFCHICLRRAERVTAIACGHIFSGQCRKVICKRCFNEHGWDWGTAITKGSGWTCTHCQRICPERAQCYNYSKTNNKRHVALLKKKEQRKKLTNQTQ